MPCVAPRLHHPRKQKIEARKNRATTCAKASLVAIATATAAAVFTTATATAAARAFFARLGHVDSEGASVDFLAVHGFNGLVGFLAGTHGDESKAARTAGC